MNVVEYDIEREDYDSHYEGTHPGSSPSLTLKVIYELLPVSPGEAVFGDLSFGHLLAEPWAPGELEAWSDRWKQLVLGTFDNVFELEVYTGSRISGTSRVELTGEYNSEDHSGGVGLAYRNESSLHTSWADARDPNNAEFCGCRLDLTASTPAAERVHLRIRVAKGRPSARPSHTPYHGHGADLPAGGTSADVDMLLLSGDLEPHEDSSGRSQTRALNEFGRYLGCWALHAGERDLMSSGDQLRPWHGWPWWRRFADHIDGRRREERWAHTTVFASVVIVRLVSTGERTRRTELESETGRPDDQQQALLRDQSPDISPGEVVTGVLIGVLVAGALAFTIGAAYMIGVYIDQGHI